MLQGEAESAAAADRKSFGRPRLSSIGQVYAGLSDEEVEVGRASPTAFQAAPALYSTHVPQSHLFPVVPLLQQSSLWQGSCIVAQQVR